MSCSLATACISELLMEAPPKEGLGASEGFSPGEIFALSILDSLKMHITLSTQRKTRMNEDTVSTENTRAFL